MPRQRYRRRNKSKQSQQPQLSDIEGPALTHGDSYRLDVELTVPHQHANTSPSHHHSYWPGDRQMLMHGESWTPDTAAYSSLGDYGMATQNHAPFQQSEMSQQDQYQQLQNQIYATHPDVYAFPAMPWLRHQYPPALPPVPFPQYQMPFQTTMLASARSFHHYTQPFTPISRANDILSSSQTLIFTRSQSIFTPRRIQPPVAPTPTKEYLAEASLEPVSTDSLRPLLIILDMNGTLIYRKRRSAPSSLVRRPYLDSFLKHMFDQHNVMIWTSSKPATVKEIMKRLFDPATQSKFVAVWARDKLGLSTEQYNEKVQVYKRLDKIWTDDLIRSGHPGSENDSSPEECVWNQSNTVLVDDSKIKAAGHPHNIIEIPEFTNDASVDERGNLQIVLRQLRILARQRDVSRKIRQWTEKREAVDQALSANEFWEAELRKDEEKLGLEGDIALDMAEEANKIMNNNTKKKKKQKQKPKLQRHVARPHFLPTTNIEQEINAAQASLETTVHIHEGNATRYDDELSDVTDDEIEKISTIPHTIIEQQDPTTSTTRVPALFPPDTVSQ
ncbi:hypothetical protein PRK78_007448 [Emydomyces testavorans]|uniref:Mitochondrial import inner membrane translocase subunit TIM50 n=1 Tax=Emydomyces testavorans TaxID=2070801 RepID=A0AAF0ILP3_9EURO|nr:hypothetical protein PRK78_007448 [Emydomyces testavorans]